MPSPLFEPYLSQAALDGTLVTDNDVWVHLYPLIVQYEDTDAGGIAYHSCYINYVERARSALLRCCGYSLASELEAEQQGFVVSELTADYRMPARLHDSVVVRTTLDKLGGASVRLIQDVHDAQSGHILARVRVYLVWMKFEVGPARFPEKLKEILTSFT